jgi:phosphatidylethanolamine-binding protein (PEBP) family uncharacterized protein
MLYSATHPTIQRPSRQSAMELTSPCFVHDADIPPEFTCDRANLSPAFDRAGDPCSAQSLFLVCFDPDALGGTFHHWAIHSIPAGWAELAADDG